MIKNERIELLYYLIRLNVTTNHLKNKRTLVHERTEMAQWSHFQSMVFALAAFQDSYIEIYYVDKLHDSRTIFKFFLYF